jgi:hypothetical protein
VLIYQATNSEGHTNVMMLSDKELATFGLPSHASIQANQAVWQHFAENSHRTCRQGSQSHLYFHDYFPHAKTASTTPNTIGDGCNGTPGSQCQDGIWAGNLALSRGRGAYRIAQIYVRVPSINTSDPSAEVAFWAGIGGDGHIAGNPVLVQSAIVVSVVNGKRYVETDIEVAPNVKAYNLPLCKTLGTNDNIYLYAESNVNNDGYDYFYIRDDADGCSNSCYVGTNNSNPPVHIAHSMEVLHLILTVPAVSVLQNALMERNMVVVTLWSNSIHQVIRIKSQVATLIMSQLVIKHITTFHFFISLSGLSSALSLLFVIRHYILEGKNK